MVGRHTDGRMSISVVWQTYQQRVGMSSGGGCLDSRVGISMMGRHILTFVNAGDLTGPIGCEAVFYPQAASLAPFLLQVCKLILELKY